MNRSAIFRSKLTEEILILDGAMGTMIQEYGLTEADFRGERFADHHIPLKGNNDVLCLTRPDVITEIHCKYLRAGADIIETCSFNSNTVSQNDYDLTEHVAELNYAAASLARKAADIVEAETGRVCFVAGVLGPTSRTASMAPDEEDPAARNLHFDALAEDYYLAVENLHTGGADIILIETVFDALNVKAAIYAVQEYNNDKDIDLPIMISATITDASGRTLTGQTVSAFYTSISHGKPVTMGLNCALGADALIPYIHELNRIVNCGISMHPNAGLPDELGNYNHSPEQMAEIIEGLAKERLINIVGGCCGTSPAHIQAICNAVKKYPPKEITTKEKYMRLSGLEMTEITPESLFINIGERTNVSGSRKFARLIREKKYEEALSIAQDQVESGAQIIDVNLDDAMLDAEVEMTQVLNYFASDPAVSRVPTMIDSSRWSAIEAGLKVTQGKGVVNSISLKEGEEKFIAQARRIMRFGSAVVVMAFDEKGQADTKERKIDICERSYNILVDTVGFTPHDIIFDPNIFAVGTGLDEHRRYAIDFIEGTREIHRRMPKAHISGGVSNVSFSFRGNNVVREAMHTCFLFHATRAGMDMGIVNPSMLEVYDKIDPTLRERIEDLLFDRREDATERLLDYSQGIVETAPRENKREEWLSKPIDERINTAVVKGIVDYLENDLEELRTTYKTAVEIIEGPLMASMDYVSELFGNGKMFLPQVVKSARVMKKAVSYLQPYIEAEKKGAGTSAGKILIATVKGDVHDIGKNIVGIILQCNNYEVIDLGVMVHPDIILDTAQRENVDAIGLSGLVTPSLDEMVFIAQQMTARKMTIPLMLGGATTSPIHTAVKVAPEYNCVIQVKDASRMPGIIKRLLSPSKKPLFLKELHDEYEQLRNHSQQALGIQKMSLAVARKNRLAIDWETYTPPVPSFTGKKVLRHYTVDTLLPYIDWSLFFSQWKLKGSIPAIFSHPDYGTDAQNLFNDAQTMLERISRENLLRIAAVVGFFPAHSDTDDIIIQNDTTTKRIRTLRQQSSKKGVHLALADYIAPQNKGNDYIGMFAITTGLGLNKTCAAFEKNNDSYSAMLITFLANSLAEALSEKLHEDVRTTLWGYENNEKQAFDELLAGKYRGIRPAPGYPACPDHRMKESILAMLSAEDIGMSLTDTYMIHPGSSICGYYFSSPESSYFGVGKITEEQLKDYANRGDESLDTARQWLKEGLV